MAKEDITVDVARVFHKQAVEFICTKPMHWNNSDKFFQVFQLIFTLVIVDGKPLNQKYVSWPYFPFLSHMEALIYCENVSLSLLLRGLMTMLENKHKPLSFGNKRKHVVPKSSETWELSM